ncbi:hypothetical protein DH09_13815 [Bacillaceae bacterium JMAK1]|nr:hypothetical protein DH09_13815 [Bacillaceae bacterium JMAK1]
MEMKDLRIFVSVARHGSASQAAKELCYVQSYVTSRIQSLEREYERTFFQRYHRGMRLNHDGELFLDYAEKILSTVDQLRGAMSMTQQKERLRIGTIDTVNQLPALLASFHSMYPAIDFRINRNLSPQLKEAVLKDELDGAFVIDTEVSERLDSLPVFEEQLVLVSHRNASLLEQPFLVFSEGCKYRNRLKAYLTSIGVFDSSMMSIDALETIIGCVRAGMGTSFLPYSVVEPYIQTKEMTYFLPPEEFSSISINFIRKSSNDSPSLARLHHRLKQPSVHPAISI